MRSWIKKHLPTRKQILATKSLKWMSQWLQKRPYLWEWNKHSVAGGVAVSLLVAFIPLPIQMALAALLALLFRVNLPIAIVVTWLTNPVTFIPANYLIYKIGEWVTHSNGGKVTIPNVHMYWNHLGLTIQELMAMLGSIGKVYLVGFPIVSIGFAVMSYILVYSVWTLYELIVRYKNKN